MASHGALRLNTNYAAWHVRPPPSTHTHTHTDTGIAGKPGVGTCPDGLEDVPKQDCVAAAVHLFEAKHPGETSTNKQLNLDNTGYYYADGCNSNAKGEAYWVPPIGDNVMWKRGAQRGRWQLCQLPPAGEEMATPHFVWLPCCAPGEERADAAHAAP